MSDAGYITEIDYLHGFFPELSVPRLRLALLWRGIGHSVGDSPDYLELGFGQGLSLAINAATTSGRFVGTDFNAGHAANAARLAAATGKDVRILEDSFEQLAARTDLPDFDIIVLHGIWSWVSADSRKAIVALARNRLRPGGILYVSYNSTPGWSPALPLRHLLNEYAKRATAGAILGKVDRSIAFVEEVIAAGALYFRNNPSLEGRIRAIRQQDRSYITHEYFNENWAPMSFSDVSDDLAEAKLGFAASANLIENIEGVYIDQETRDLLDRLPDPVLRETTKDYFINQQFRRDIFVKGGRKLSPAEILARMADVAFVCTGDPANPPAKVNAPLGEADLRPDIYGPVTAAIAGLADAPFTQAMLSRDPACSSLEPWQVAEALVILTAAGFLAPAGDAVPSGPEWQAAQSLNRAICNEARFASHMSTLAAPMIGSGIGVGRIEQLFLLAADLGADDAVEFVWQTLDRQGHRIVINGSRLDDEAANRSAIQQMHADFTSRQLPQLRRLGCV